MSLQIHRAPDFRKYRAIAADDNAAIATVITNLALREPAQAGGGALSGLLRGMVSCHQFESLQAHAKFTAGTAPTVVITPYLYVIKRDPNGKRFLDEHTLELLGAAVTIDSASGAQVKEIPDVNSGHVFLHLTTTGTPTLVEISVAGTKPQQTIMERTP